MKVTLVILAVFVVLFFFAALIIAVGLNIRIEKLQNDLQVIKNLYDGLEEQVAKQYADMATMSNSLEQYKEAVGKKIIRKKQ
jgi:predicted PurR-regulated permease PerM